MASHQHPGTAFGHDGLAAGREELERQHDELTSGALRPFSHDSRFSVSARNAHGYRLQVIDEIIVIGANGQIVAVEPPAGERRRKGVMPAPTVVTPQRHDPLRFLWGPAHNVLGVSGSRRGMFDRARAAEDHLKFKAFHHRVLEGVGDIALQAFLRFLERHTASAVSEFPTIAGRPRCRLAFRFQYDEHYLHERHAAQLAWKRFLIGRPPDADQTPPVTTVRT